jgi:uncharacterized membrane protein YdfJ with MMPL/SSD domain
MLLTESGLLERSTTYLMGNATQYNAMQDNSMQKMPLRGIILITPGETGGKAK